MKASEYGWTQEKSIHSLLTLSLWMQRENSLELSFLLFNFPLILFIFFGRLFFAFLVGFSLFTISRAEWSVSRIFGALATKSDYLGFLVELPYVFFPASLHISLVV